MAQIHHRRLINALERNDLNKEYHSDKTIRNDYKGKHNASRIVIALFFIILMFNHWNWIKDGVKMIPDIVKHHQVYSEKRSNIVEKFRQNQRPLVVGIKDKALDSYIEQMIKSGIDTHMKKYQIQGLLTSNIPPDYLSKMNKEGYLKNYSFPEILAFYNNNVDANYLNRLKRAGLLDKMSFVDIIRMKIKDGKSG